MKFISIISLPFIINLVSFVSSNRINITSMTNSTFTLVEKLLNNRNIVEKLPPNFVINLAKNRESVSSLGGARLPSDRALVSNSEDSSDYNMADSFLKLFQTYGCWCSFQGNFAGAGIPVDRIDRKCKQLNEAYECANSEIPNCEPWNTNFALPKKAHKIQGENEIISECNKANPDASECVKTSCYIQVNFVLNLFEVLFSNLSLDEQYMHSNGFDPLLGCATHNKKVQVDRKCCGEYPSRTIYNNALNECCDDGKARFMCL